MSRLKAPKNPADAPATLQDALKEAEPFVNQVLAKTDKFKLVRDAYVAYRVIQPFYKHLTRPTTRSKPVVTYTYKLVYQSPIYTTFSTWLRENLPSPDLTNFEVESARQLVYRPKPGDKTLKPLTTAERVSYHERAGSNEYYEPEDEEVVTATVPKFTFKVNQPKGFNYNGQRITVSIDEGEKAADGETTVMFLTKDINLSADGIKGKEAIELFLNEMLTATQSFNGDDYDEPNEVYVINTNRNEWRWRGYIPPRNFNNVFLNEGLAEDICGDIENFLKLQPNYERLGLPYHRGYLLHGPPGTGKTSVVQAIANKFDLDLYILSLNQVKTDGELSNLFHSVRAQQSIILIEDVDAIHAAMNRSKDDGRPSEGVTLSGFLNVIDGVTSASGTILFLTTNDELEPDPDEPGKERFKRLDKALVRPGRIDYRAEIGYIDENQYRGFFTLFFGSEPLTDYAELDFDAVPPVEVLECFKRHPLDIVAADAFLRETFLPENRENARLAAEAERDRLAPKPKKAEKAKKSKKAEKPENGFVKKRSVKLSSAK